MPEGEEKLAKMLTSGILQSIGAASWPIPEFNRAHWAPDGSYVDVWMDGQHVTTARNHAGGASAYVRGWTVDWVKVTTAALQADAGGSGWVGVRVTPPAGYAGPATGVSGRFDYGSKVSFGRGAIPGFTTYNATLALSDLDPANPYTLDLPAIAGLAPGMAVVPVQPRSMERNAAYTANTLSAPAVFSTSGTQRFVSPTSVGAAGFASPQKLRVYMKGVIPASTGTDQRLAAIASWATITCRSLGVIRISGLGTTPGNLDHGTSLTFGSNFTLMVTIDRTAQRVDITLNGVTASFTGLTTISAFPTAQVASLLATSGGTNPTSGTFERIAMWIDDAEADPTALPAAAGWFDAAGNAAAVTAAYGPSGANWLVGTLA